jgi:hypothetical protein
MEGIQEAPPGHEWVQREVNIATYWIVFKRNPYGKIGTLYRRFEDGYEPVYRNKDGEMAGYEGLVMPHATMAPFLMAVKKNGIDAGAARQDRQRAMQRHGEW